MTQTDTRLPSPTAAVLIIGEEILSGRTQDANLAMIGRHLSDWGVRLKEARVVPDEETAIVGAVNALRTAYDYLFTTGGIGPTHDDITADCIARAFRVGIDVRADALALLESRYARADLTPARRRMARIPDGAALIENPVSAAPGFQLGNVFVMAGIPMIAETMMAGLKDRVSGGPPVLSATVKALLPEGALAEGLGRIQLEFPEVTVGSYPYLRGREFGVNVVLRGTDPARLEAARRAVEKLVRDLGGMPEDD